MKQRARKRVLVSAVAGLSCLLGYEALFTRPASAEAKDSNIAEPSAAKAAPAAEGASAPAPAQESPVPAASDTQNTQGQPDPDKVTLETEHEKEDAGDEGLPCKAANAAEMKILTALRERREELDDREHHLALREKTFATSQGKLSARVETLSAALAELEKQLELGEPAKKAREERLKSLVDAIDSLSAKKAAPMLAEADPSLVGEILRRVGPVRTAGLLAVMPTAKAARLINQVGTDIAAAKATEPGAAPPATGKKP